uniref:ATP-dependent RNA helicase n=1 Tax=Setaria digitata TaxID=48799 RepID=A0A915PPN8_9BILA
MREQGDYRWGDYYLSGGRKGKKSWALELIHTANQMIPTFNELFDEETFYVFAFIVVISSFLVAFFLAKVVGIRIREYPLNVNREWRDAEPANPFRFPWNPQFLDGLDLLGIYFLELRLHLSYIDLMRLFFIFKTGKAADNIQQTVERLLKHEDVIVQAPTGSGKTLAYVLPLFTILGKKKVWQKNEVGAVVIVPTRELAKQVAAVCNPFADALNLDMCVVIGGKKGKRDPTATQCLNATVIIATPGRLKLLISSNSDFKKALKALEILIVDEADRYTDSTFKASMTEILESLPKQRRTGLFSATQAKEMEEIVKFGLRNPVQITLASCGSVLDSIEMVEAVSPNTLNNFYMVVKADQKLHLLVEFIRSHPYSKILIFFSTCQCVEYMQTVLKHLIQKRQVFALHGKKKKKVENQLQCFRRIGKSVMLCTDVLSRGIDVENIDWVVQFDIPKQTSWFVHRAGRSARCGRKGNNVLFLTPEETAYIQFIEKYEKVSLTKMETNLRENDPESEQIRQQIVEIASKEREILESGTRAFMSFIESYVRHDCNVVCSFKNLDVVGYGHAYGLLRLPRMKEFKHNNLSDFKRSDLNTSEIPYKNAEKEKQRQEKLLLLDDENKGMKRKMKKKENGPPKKRLETPKIAKKRRRSGSRENVDDFKSDFSLLKKLKKGRLKKKEYDELLTDNTCH